MGPAWQSIARAPFDCVHYYMSLFFLLVAQTVRPLITKCGRMVSDAADLAKRILLFLARGPVIGMLILKDVAGWVWKLLLPVTKVVVDPVNAIYKSIPYNEVDIRYVCWGIVEVWVMVLSKEWLLFSNVVHTLLKPLDCPLNKFSTVLVSVDDERKVTGSGLPQHVIDRARAEEEDRKEEGYYDEGHQE